MACPCRGRGDRRDAAVYNNCTQVAADYGGAVDRFFEYWGRPEELQRHSPRMAAGNFNTPTLVIHGQLDYRMPVNHGIELFHALQKRGAPSRLVHLPDENHWILKPQNPVFRYSQARDWAERYAPPGGRQKKRAAGGLAPNLPSVPASR